jgi:transposase
MIRMLLVGYGFGIRSERRLCSEVHLNLAYRWFCGLGPEDRVADHSTFPLNRHGRFRDSGLTAMPKRKTTNQEARTVPPSRRDGT